MGLVQMGVKRILAEEETVRYVIYLGHCQTEADKQREGEASKSAKTYLQECNVGLSAVGQEQAR